MKSPLKAIFYFCIFCVLLATILFAFKGINPLSLNVFHLKPIWGDTDEGNSANASSIPVVPKPNINQQLILTESDLTKLISESASEYLSKPKVKINQNNIAVSADIIKVIKTRADLTIKINFSKNKVSAEILELKTGVLTAPNWLKSNIANLINKKLDSEINKKYKISGISQETGKIIISVNK